MLTIRLTRKGKKNQPFFRVIVIDKRRTASGGVAVEDLGYVDPLTKRRNFKKDRILYWLSKGAQPSATIHNYLVSEKIIEGTKVKLTNISKKKQAEIAEAKKAEAAKAAAPVAAPEAKPVEAKPAEPTVAPVSAETPAAVPEVKPAETPKPVELAPKIEEKPTV
jgi:small subunit ribosomal protein S16